MNDPDRPEDGQTRLTLDAKQFDALARLIENPPSPGPKLKALLHRTPAWDRQATSDRCSAS